MTAESAPEKRSLSSSARWLWLAVLALIIVGVVAIALAVWQLWPAGAGNDALSLTLAPAQNDEFLIIAAPFHRQGGDPQPIGGTLANDLRFVPNAAELYRVETLPRAPQDAEIANLIQAYSPSVLVTGSYDGSDVLADVHLSPPAYVPPPSSNGGNALSPFLDPTQYKVYAPQGLERPLRYLQSWIVAQSLFWQGDYEGALPHLQEAKQLLPRQAPVEYRADMDAFAANINWQQGYIAGPVQGNWQAARDLFNEALRQSPQDPAPAVGLAAALAQLNDLERAAAILRATLRNHPDAWQIHFALAEIALQQGDENTAFSSYDRAISLLSNSAGPAAQSALADIYFNRGYYRLNHGDPRGAQEDLQQALDLGRNDIYVQGALGWAAYQSGDDETAIRASAAARQLAPDRPDLAFNEALALLSSGQIDAAGVAYDEAIKLTLTIDDTLTRSTYFGVAYNDLAELAQLRPDLTEIIADIQERIDIANG